MAVLTPVICGKWWVGLLLGTLGWVGTEYWYTALGCEVTGQAEAAQPAGSVRLDVLRWALKGPHRIRGMKNTNLLLTGSHFVYQSTLELCVVQVDLEPV